MKVQFIQPNLPHYRIPFFNKLASDMDIELSVFSSKGKLGALTSNTTPLWSNIKGLYIEKFGIVWQQHLINFSLKNIDVLVVAGNPRNIPMLILSIRARILGIKCVWLGHYKSSTTKNWRLNIRLLLYLIPKNICFYSDNELNMAKKRLRKPHLNLFSISNGVDSSHIKKYRAPYLASERQKKIIFIGRLKKDSKINNLIDALKIMHDQYAMTDVSLDIIGEGPEEERIEEQIDKLNISSCINLHGALTNEKNISKIFNEAAIFISADRVGLSILHSLSYGVPVLVNDARDSQGPEVDVMLLSDVGEKHEGTALSIAKKASALLNNIELRDNYSSAALYILNSHHNTDIMYTRFKELIKSI